jgi:hypothetical protein
MKQTTNSQEVTDSSSRAIPSGAGPTEAKKLPGISVERVQTGLRIEKRMLKVLKAVAEYADQSLGELMEEIVLHSFEGACAFGPETRKHIAKLKEVYGMDYDVHASYRFVDKTA